MTKYITLETDELNGRQKLICLQDRRSSDQLHSHEGDPPD